LLDQLGASDREILVMRHLRQLSFAEIADVLGIKVVTANVRHFRALERIRVLKQNEGSESIR